MSESQGSIPEVLAVVLAQAARAISFRQNQKVGEQGRMGNYATLLREYEPEILWFLKAWVEIYTEGRYTVRRVHSDLLRGWKTSESDAISFVGVCHYERPQDEALLQLARDECIYRLSAPYGISDGVQVRRLIY